MQLTFIRWAEFIINVIGYRAALTVKDKGKSDGETDFWG